MDQNNSNKNNNKIIPFAFKNNKKIDYSKENPDNWSLIEKKKKSQASKIKKLTRD